MNKITDYTIVFGEVTAIIDKVIAEIKDGWQPFGRALVLGRTAMMCPKWYSNLRTPPDWIQARRGLHRP